MTQHDSGPVTWVVGGGSGIGQAIALRLAERGHRVAVSGRRQSALQDTVRQSRCSAILPVPMDGTDDDSVAHAHAAIVERLGPVSLLICSAGMNVPRRSWSELAATDLARIVDTNLTSVGRCVLSVLPRMRTAGDGQIVIVSSWSGWRFLPVAGAGYSSSKLGLGALVESINDQEGRNGIRATHLCPGEVATAILQTRPVPPTPEELARMLDPAQLADVVAYLTTLPPAVCVNEMVISPTANRFYPPAGKETP